jgi:hypothetical protein
MRRQSAKIGMVNAKFRTSCTGSAPRRPDRAETGSPSRECIARLPNAYRAVTTRIASRGACARSRPVVSPYRPIQYPSSVSSSELKQRV